MVLKVFSKVSPYTGIGPRMALPSRKGFQNGVSLSNVIWLRGERLLARHPFLHSKAAFLKPLVRLLNWTGSVFLRITLSTAGNSMTSSERPSPEPILEKEASPAVLGGREFLKCSGSHKCLEL